VIVFFLDLIISSAVNIFKYERDKQKKRLCSSEEIKLSGFVLLALFFWEIFLRNF
jgi:hypothetical protein